MRYIFRKLIFVSIIFFSGLSLSPPANGKVNIEISPHVDIQGTYSDNIGFAADTSVDSREDDFYTVIVPGVSLKIPNRFLDFKADYGYWYYRYTKYSFKNRGYHKANIEVGKALAIFKNIYLDFGDRYEFVPVNIRLPEDASDNQAQRNNFYLRPSWTKDLNRRNRLNARYKFNRVDYIGSGKAYGENYSAHYFNTGWKNKVASWMIFSLNGGYQIKNYDNLPKYTQFNPQAGLSLAPLKNLTLVSRVGYFLENIGFDQGDNIAYYLSAAYKRTDKLEVKASFQRERNFDIEGRLFTEDQYKLNCLYQPGSRLGFDWYIWYNEYLHPGEDIKMLGARFTIRYHLSREIVLRGGYIRNQRFETSSEENAYSNRFYLGLAVVL